MVDKKDLFEDIAVAIESWTNAAVEATTNQDAQLQWVERKEPYRSLQVLLASSDRSDLQEVFAECLRGVAVSILTAIDGGTALARKGRLHLVDDQGRNIGEGLHEEFVDHLFETGRLQ